MSASDCISHRSSSAPSSRCGSVVARILYCKLVPVIPLAFSLISGADYTWDSTTTSGIQPGSGIWGSDDFWTSSSGDGTSLISWPGSGNSATFTGSDGSYTITISGTQTVNGMTFSNNGYTLTGGTINWPTTSNLTLGADITAPSVRSYREAEESCSYRVLHRAQST